MLKDSFRTANILCSLKTVIAKLTCVYTLWPVHFRHSLPLTRGQKNPVLQDAFCIGLYILPKVSPYIEMFFKPYKHGVFTVKFTLNMSLTTQQIIFIQTPIHDPQSMLQKNIKS